MLFVRVCYLVVEGLDGEALGRVFQVQMSGRVLDAYRVDLVDDDIAAHQFVGLFLFLDNCVRNEQMK